MKRTTRMRRLFQIMTDAGRVVRRDEAQSLTLKLSSMTFSMSDSSERIEDSSLDMRR